MMNEIEIIKYLKENKCRGVAFMLMPQDVRVWCIKHADEPIFSRLCSAGWDYTKRTINTREKNGVYFLSKDYEPEPQFVPHWVEFEIEYGFFIENQVSKDASSKTYYWWEWTKFLSDNCDKYNAFGGWLYSGNWELSPNVINDKDWRLHSYTFYMDDVRPLYPTKIRFWRFKNKGE